MCVHWFKKGENYCEYGTTKRYPGCCDKHKCECTCIYLCQTKKQIADQLKTHQKLNDFDNTKCTNEITSEAEGREWRKRNCLADRANKTKGTTGY